MNHKIIKTLLLADGLFIFAGGLVGPIWAVFVKEVGGDILEASTSYALFMLTAAGVTYFLGKLEDHERRKFRFVVLGYLIGTIAYIGYLFVDNAIKLFMIQILLGCAAAIKDPAYDGLLSKFSKKHTTLAWGEWEAMDYVATGIAAIVGGVIAQYIGFNFLIICMITFSTAGLVASLKLLRSS